MIHIDKYQLINLEDGKEYVVIDSIIYDDDNYVYLINSKDVKDQLIALVTKENNDTTIHIVDSSSEENKDVINKISDAFIDSFKKNYNMEGFDNDEK